MVYLSIRIALGLPEIDQSSSNQLSKAQWFDKFQKEYPLNNCTYGDDIALHPLRNLESSGLGSHFMSRRNSNDGICGWFALQWVVISKKRVQFQIDIQIETPGYYALIGEKTTWPQNIRVHGSSAIVMESKEVPHLYLQKAAHNITGSFEWEDGPKSILIPEHYFIEHTNKSMQSETDGTLVYTQEKKKRGTMHVLQKVRNGHPVF